MADELTPAFFSPLVGSEFVTEWGPLVLDSLVEQAPTPGAPRAQPFSLLFVGPPGGHLPQQIYGLRHSAVGELHIFLVPIGPRSDGRPQFEAVFN